MKGRVCMKDNTCISKRKRKKNMTYFSVRVQLQDYDSNQRDLKEERETQMISYNYLANYAPCNMSPLHTHRFLVWLLPLISSLLPSLTLDGEMFGGPLLLEGGERLFSADADDRLLEVKRLCVKLQQTKPQLPHGLPVLLVLRPVFVLRNEQQSQTCSTKQNIFCCCSWHVSQI